MDVKYKVVDTNVLLVDPISAIYGFRPKAGYRNHLIIPGYVMGEMDKLKNEKYSERGYNARVFSNELTKIIEKGTKAGVKSICEDIELDNNYFIRVVLDSNPTSFSPEGFNNDDYIIGVAKKLRDDNPLINVEMVSNDRVVKIKASALGLNVSDWEGARAVSDIGDIYKGWRTVFVDDGIINNIGKGYLDVKNSKIEGLENLMANEYILFINKNLPSSYKVPYFNETNTNTNEFALGRYVKNIQGLEQGGIIDVKPRCSKQSNVMNIFARNYEQAFALDALINPNIKLVNLIGPAGTGKTLLAIAGGLDGLSINNNLKSKRHVKSKVKSNSVINRFRNKHGIYEKVFITRVMVPSAYETIGILPGDIPDKMSPYLMPIYDNLKSEMFEALVNKIILPEDRNEIKSKTDPLMFRDSLMENNKLEIQPVSTIRGRSIDDSYIIVDESQNASINEIKTIITRAGENTKLVFAGDPAQIDRAGLTELINGLMHSSERFKGEDISATIYLSKGERSHLATLGSKIL